MTDGVVLPDHVEEYFLDKDTAKELLLSRELFKADENLDLKTDVSFKESKELVLVNKLYFMGDFLKRTVGYSPFNSFVAQYLRLKISADRQSRMEFVDINKKENFDNNLKKIANFKTVLDAKQ